MLTQRSSPTPLPFSPLNQWDPVLAAQCRAWRGPKETEKSQRACCLPYTVEGSDSERGVVPGVTRNVRISMGLSWKLSSLCWHPNVQSNGGSFSKSMVWSLSPPCIGAPSRHFSCSIYSGQMLAITKQVFKHKMALSLFDSTNEQANRLTGLWILKIPKELLNERIPFSSISPSFLSDNCFPLLAGFWLHRMCISDKAK